MSQAPTREPVHLEDYRAPAYTTTDVTLEVDLDAAATEVTSTQTIVRNPDAQADTPAELVLYGENQDLLELTVDGREHAIERHDDRLTLRDLPDRFELRARSRTNPAANKRLMGLYLSNGVFCTQCEAEGFRRITWFQDRPDVMARYRVRITGDKRACPLLLSNGNLVDSGDLSGGRHWALWEDPFPKPSYLFALVAGDLATLEGEFVTRSGRRVALRIHADAKSIDQCHHALASLKKAMAWDEARFGREYDLDLFQIVAVSDFNFGAMENKGLNIFNTSAALAKRETATDADFVSVERIIAHEYFHNWTGDRVTCRDWFQLTLKEGLTVFRDQEFTMDHHSAAVKRIGDVVLLRDSQFPEDSGPLAHPIRPASYIEINNFYTRTVYEKGAEVIRMLHTLIGEDAFRKGMDLYFERHDGEAVTCEDFVAAMAEAAGRDLGTFMRWYGQAGTPELTARGRYDADAGTYTLEIAQKTPPTPGQPEKQPLLLPLRLGLVGRRSGAELPLQLEGENEPRGTDRVLELTEAEQRLTFTGLAEEPVPSLFRGFSAPVKLDAGLGAAELAHLFAHDSDPFVRWDAGQSLALAALRRLIDERDATPRLAPELARAFAAGLDRAGEDHALAARALVLPSASYLGQQMQVIDVDGIAFARATARAELGRGLRDRWLETYRACDNGGPFSIEPAAMGRRALKNVALAYLAWAGDDEGRSLAQRQFERADNMTDSLAALRAIVEAAMPGRDAALESFYERWQHEPLVVDKWFALQATTEAPDAAGQVAALLAHPAFSMSNPNRVRSVLGAFAAQNLTGFHAEDGGGYRLVADKVLELDRINPQVAARLITAFGRWRRFDAGRQAMMRAGLERILAAPGLSRDSYEIAKKSLG